MAVFPPEEVFRETLSEQGLGPLDQRRVRNAALGSPSSAASALERAGFLEVRARGKPLGYRFDPTTFLGWKEHRGERELFDALDRTRRKRLIDLLRARLGRLSADDFVLQDAIVYVSGRREETVGVADSG
jgi:hypothetical protein